MKKQGTKPEKRKSTLLAIEDSSDEEEEEEQEDKHLEKVIVSKQQIGKTKQPSKPKI